MKGDDDDDEDAGSLGVARYPCMPSLVALQQMRNRLQLAHLGRKLMKWTALATGKEMRRLAMELDEASKSFHEDCKNAYVLLARCRYCFPGMNHFVLESVPHHPLTAHVKITTTIKTVTAVKCIIYTVVKLDRDPYDMFMVGRGGEQCLEARQTWFDLLLSIIHWLQLRACYEAAEAAHLAATKKSKVLGKVVIPKINETIAYILSEMEERAREEFFRMKKIIEVKTKRKKKGDKIVIEELLEPPVLPPVEEPPPESPVLRKKPCPHVCVIPEKPLVVADVSSELEEELEFIPEEPDAEPEPEPPCGWGALPSAQIGSGKPILVPKTPPTLTPKPSRPRRPCGRPSPVSTRPSVRITIPSESEEIVENVSTYEKDTVNKTVSKITTARSMPEMPSQPLERTIQGPVCRVCKSCRPRPQCKHKVFDSDVCKLCQICCKTPSVIMTGRNEDQFSVEEDEEQLETEEMVKDIVETEVAESVADGSLRFEDIVSINTIGSTGDLLLEDNATAPVSYTSDSIYKIESSQTTTVRKIVKKDGTVIQEREVTKVTIETVPEDLERSKSNEINAQIAELQKFLCNTCVKNEEPKESKSVTASAADNVAEGAEWSNVIQRHTKDSGQGVQFRNICECANCPEPNKMETICWCKTTDPPDTSDPAKCSYEWSCGGAIPECSIRKKKKKEGGDVNSRER